MKGKINWSRIIYIIGVIAFIIGAFDPLEGSIVIAADSGLIALATHLTHDQHRKIFLALFIMIVTGVFFLFYLSSYGGFGGNAPLSWWWGTLILPYPIGWFISCILFFVRVVNKQRLPNTA